MTKINDFTLKNGLKVIFVEDRANPVMSIQLYVRSGSNWEYDNEDGFRTLPSILSLNQLRIIRITQLWSGHLSWAGQLMPILSLTPPVIF